MLKKTSNWAVFEVVSIISVVITVCGFLLPVIHTHESSNYWIWELFQAKAPLQVTRDDFGADILTLFGLLLRSIAVLKRERESRNRITVISIVLRTVLVFEHVLILRRMFSEAIASSFMVSGYAVGGYMVMFAAFTEGFLCILLIRKVVATCIADTPGGGQFATARLKPKRI